MDDYRLERSSSSNAASAMSSNTPFRTDAVVKGSLNVGLIPSAGARGGGPAGGGAGGAHAAAASEPSSEAYLDSFEEELHKKVDSEIGILVDGLQECVKLAKVGNKDRFKAEQDAIEVELKAESMVRATESLLSLSHTLKLLFLLNNEDEGSTKIFASQQEHLLHELGDVKEDFKGLLGEVLAKQ